MAETLFDIHSGGVFVAVPGYDAEMSADVVPLVDLLTAPEPLDLDHTYDKVDAEHWDEERYLQLGSWILSVLDESEVKTNLKRDHLVRMYQLGVGPSMKSYRRHGYSSLAEYRQELGVEAGYVKGYFDNWTDSHFVEVAKMITAETGKKPTYEDYVRYGKNSGFPGIAVVTKRFGAISKLNELLGYPDVETWDTKDYINYGLKIAEVNGVDSLVADTARVLSRRQRGPSERAIIQRFGSWNTYKQVVKDSLPQHLDVKLEQQRRRTQKLAYYTRKVQSRSLPPHYGKFKSEELLRTSARYELVSYLLPDIQPPVASMIAELQGSSGFVALITRLKPGSTARHVEIEAKKLGLHQFIWPYDESYREDLRVTQKDLEQLRKARKPYKRQRRIAA